MVSEGSMTWLMPLAATLGSYILVGSGCFLLMSYRAWKANEEEKEAGRSFKNWRLWATLISIVLAVIGYGRVVAMVQELEELAAPFDPYVILGVEEKSNISVIKNSYRTLSRKYHPDKGGDSDSFNKVNAAYRALTDSVGRRNWKEFGHPDGASHFQSLSFGLPSWLLHPTGYTAATLVILYLSLLVYLGWYVISKVKEIPSSSNNAKHTVASEMKFIVEYLTNDSSHLDILYLLASTPGNLLRAEKALEHFDACYKKKAERKKKNTKITLDISGPWADDEEDEAAKKVAELERKMKQQKQLLDNASGKSGSVDDLQIEGLDSGVIGQKWVQKVLESEQLWPPKNIHYPKQKDLNNSLQVPEVKLNFLLITARLNAKILNSQREFFECQQKRLLDSNYYKYSLEFRQKILGMLDSVTKTVIQAQNYTLTKTLIETAALFRIGVYPLDQKNIKWFNGIMMNQYGIIPKLEISKFSIQTPDEEEVATNDQSEISFRLERVHAEKFVQAKVQQAQRQGIPIPAIMGSFREVWWVLLCAKLISSPSDEPLDDSPEFDENVLTMVGKKVYDLYPYGEKEKKLITLWPMVCSNIAQKTGDMKFKFDAPKNPGKYKFSIEFINQEFLGCNSEHEIEIDVVDSADLRKTDDENKEDDDKRNEEKVEEKVEEKEEEKEEESKKDR